MLTVLIRGAAIGIIAAILDGPIIIDNQLNWSNFILMGLFQLWYLCDLIEFRSR